MAEALTGTFARADVGTLERHIESLERTVSKEEFSIYLELGRHSLKLAEAQGVDPERLAKMRERLAKAEASIAGRNVSVV
jgi:hypothetical protein